MSAEIERLEESTFLEDDSEELPPSDIVAYNELRSCADLFRMKTSGILTIQPEFQREIVWRGPQQTRFIDSLVKQLPIPSMCFSLDYRSQQWQVIDGLQRMASICRFLSGEDGWVLSKLDDIDPKLSGQPVATFQDRNSELYGYYTRVQNLALPITVLRCEYSKTSHTNYLFTIFHRLNTGAMKLNNQEIRNCIYAGPFNNLLKDLNGNSEWMKINRMKKETGYRFTKQELILRFFAFHDSYRGYAGSLARFLNEYMAEHRHADESLLDAKRRLFERTVALVYQAVFGGRVPQKLGISILEAVLVGVALNIRRLEAQPESRLQKMYRDLQKEKEFSDESLREGLAHTARVVGRMSTAKRVFSGA